MLPVGEEWDPTTLPMAKRLGSGKEIELTIFYCNLPQFFWGTNFSWRRCQEGSRGVLEPSGPNFQFLLGSLPGAFN